MHMLPAKIIQTICAVVVLSTLISCGSSPRKPSGGEEGGRELQNPSMLESMEENIEQIFSVLNGPTLEVQETERTDEKPAEEPQQESRQTENRDTGQGGQQPNSGNQEEGRRNRDASENQQQENPWNKINDSLNELHKQWNDFMPLAARLGASDRLMNDFSNSLNELTKQSISKDISKTLLTANSVYNYMSDFYQLYRTQKPSAVKKMSYYARNVILNGNLGNWDDAGSDIENLKSTWFTMKNVLGNEKQEFSGKIEFSVQELEKVVNDKNQALTDIKGRLLLANIKGLDESFDEKK